MGVPNGLTKLVISGDLCTGVEKFAIGLWFQGYTQPPATGSIDLAVIATNTEFVAFMNSMAAMLKNSEHITSLDAYWYQGGEAVTHTQRPVAYTGTNASGFMPAQIAGVLTLRTANATRSGRGRVYLPITAGESIGSNGMYAGGKLNAARVALAAWLSDYGASSSLYPVVVSQTHTSTTRITGVDNDLVPDTQRRRRNRLVSARTTSTVITP